VVQLQSDGEIQGHLFALVVAEGWRRRGIARRRIPPTDSIAQAFLAHSAADPEGRALGAYDDFAGRLDDEEFRDELQFMTSDTSKESQAFQEAARLGKELERGLLALLFETESLPKLARD
jgi:hypothetical protein